MKTTQILEQFALCGGGSCIMWKWRIYTVQVAIYKYIYIYSMVIAQPWGS